MDSTASSFEVTDCHKPKSVRDTPPQATAVYPFACDGYVLRKLK